MVSSPLLIPLYLPPAYSDEGGEEECVEGADDACRTPLTATGGWLGGRWETRTWPGVCWLLMAALPSWFCVCSLTFTTSIGLSRVLMSIHDRPPAAIFAAKPSLGDGMSGGAKLAGGDVA